MCGIVGFWRRGFRTEWAEGVVRSMARRLSHRGPDDEGCWTDAASGMALGHRRLSIIDLSPEGHQPMVSACGRWVLSYNGEVYNHQDLRTELESRAPQPWRGTSDTEVLLAGIAAWGLAATLERSIGMFAMVIWDRQEQTLQLVRDRLGVKPLYYGHVGSDLVFASEVSAFHAYPEFQGRVDRDALLAFLQYSAVPAPRTIFERVSKLLPGEIVTFKGPTAEPQRERYWDIRSRWLEAQREPFIGSFEEATDALDHALQAAVGLRMVADVPVGGFLSGGIDSSTVVALMQEQSARRVRTFSIGFDDARYDEAPYARRIAEHLRTEHTELRVTGADALALVPRIVEISDEPLGDSSLIPTYMVSELARRHVTVALSGDGADEFFGGYSHYRMAPATWQRYARVPGHVRRALASVVHGAADGPMGDLLGRWQTTERQLERGRYFASMLKATAGDPVDVYWWVYRCWNDVPELVRGARSWTQLYDERRREFEATGAAAAERVMLADSTLYLSDSSLMKVDRASMAVSLEAREPLLDHRVVELAWRLPLAYRLGEKEGTKLVLRKVLERRVPRPLFERKKQGFAVPLATWLRGDLRPWVEELLSEQRLEASGIDPVIVRRRWLQHQRGLVNWQNELWNVVMFQAWQERQQALRVQAPIGPHDSLRAAPAE